MSLLLTSVATLYGWRQAKELDRAASNPEAAQKKLLMRIISQNSDTVFGREHGFNQIKTFSDYSSAVPIREFEEFRLYINRIVKGEMSVLTAEFPTMFTLTSGTTGEPKYIPVTPTSEKLSSNLMKQWLYRILPSHPQFLSGGIVGIVSPAIEGYTPSGIPYGSVSGRIYQQIHSMIRRSYAIPYPVFELKDYDQRYLAIARFALARQISFLSTPNPTTLLRLAEVGTAQKEGIIRAIYDGSLGFDSSEQPEIVSQLQQHIRPQKQRAIELEKIATTTDALLPKDCWRQLRLIGCWLGGSVGIHAQKLALYYGNVDIRDLGYLSSEARITIPYQDNTPSGILGLTLNYCEFIPEEELDTPDPPIFLSHQLELGKRYSILLTTTAGLYRYQIYDIVEVTGFYGGTPLLAFVRKSKDMTNITGEKIHVNHLLKAMEAVEKEFNLAIVTYRFVPIPEELRYHLLLELLESPPDSVMEQLILAIDAELAKINCEYAQKRQSKRLNLPCLHIMRNGWSETQMRREMNNGRTSTQYKWKVLCEKLPKSDLEEVMKTFNNHIV
jgi:hypothetical protein